MIASKIRPTLIVNQIYIYRHTNIIVVSLRADFMQKCDMIYGIFIILPESGISIGLLYKIKINDHLGLHYQLKITASN